MRIIGPPSASYSTIMYNLSTSLTDTNPDLLRSADIFRAEMAYELWSAGNRYGIDPVGMIAQSYKETGGGTFPGKVKPSFYNTCGLKIRNQGVLGTPDDPTAGDQPLAHAMFASWQVGAEAQAQHLRAYSGWSLEMEVVPNRIIVDPRYTYVVGKHRCETFEDLSGKWATPGKTYGEEIVVIARKLQTPVPS
jgi:hypothetical protein